MSAAYFDPEDGPLDPDDTAPGPLLDLRRAEAERWLAVAVGDRDGWVALAFGVDPYRTAQDRYAHRRWTEQRYRWPTQRSLLLTDVAGLLAEGAAGGPVVDVYVCAHLRSSDNRHGPSHASGGNALPPTALHADLDGPPADAELWARLDPLEVASGSPGHVHGLVVLAEPLGDLDRWAQLQRALRDRLGGGADNKIAHNDVLRLPGTVNGKSTAPALGAGPAAPPTPVTLVGGWSGRVWPLPELAAVLGVDLSEPAPAQPGRSGPLAVPTAVPVPTDLPPRVREVVDGFAAAPDKSSAWSSLIWRAGGAGYSRDQAYALAVTHGLPHVPRYQARPVAEFDRSWGKFVQAAERAPSDRVTARDVRRMVEDAGGDLAQVREVLDGHDPALWGRLRLDSVFGLAPRPAAAHGPAGAAPDGVQAVLGRLGPERSAPDPVELLDGLLDQLAGWLLLPDAVPLVAALAVAVTAKDGEGDAAWLLLVAPPSSAKTEIIRLLDVVTDARLDDLTVGGLLSWTRGKNPVPMGVLARVRRGLLTFGDMSSLLAGSDHGGRDEVYALLRRVADGELNRDVAPPSRVATPETSLNWRGRIQVVAAATGVIDRYANHNAALGDRWLQCRTAELTKQQRREASRLCKKRDLTGNRDHAAKLAAELVEVARARVDHDGDLPDALAELIEDAAQVTAWGRASVPRATTGGREIEDVPTIEAPMRLVRQLDVIARGVLALGLTEDDAATVVRRLAGDSMPAARAGVLRALAQASEPMTTTQVCRAAGVAGDMHWNVAARRLEELATVGVVEALDESAGADHLVVEPDGRVVTRWRLASDDVDLIRGVMAVLTCIDISHELPPHSSAGAQRCHTGPGGNPPPPP